MIPEYFTANPVGCKNCHHETFKAAYNFKKDILVLKCTKCGTAIFLSINETIEGNVAEWGKAQ